MTREPRLGLAALFAAGALMGVAAQAAPAFPAFPRTSSAAALGQWISTQTDLPLSSVVLVGPGYVFAFQSPDPPADVGGFVWKRIREEVIGAGVESRLNGRSATAEIAFDCGRDQATASQVVVYAGNNLQGQNAQDAVGREVPAAEWMVANPGLYLMDLAKAACDPGFRRPFAGETGADRWITADASARGAEIARALERGLRAEAGSVHWVQVGAFANAAAANARWRAIQKMLPAEGAGRTIKIEPVGRGGKTLVRALVGPFHGAAPAVAFCAALKARGGDCLVR